MFASMDPHSPSPYLQHHHHNSTKYAAAHRLLPPPFPANPNLLRPPPPPHPPPPFRLPPPPPPPFSTHNSQFVSHPSLASGNHHHRPIVHEGDRPDFPHFHRAAAHGDGPRRRITEFAPQRQQLQQRQQYPRESREFFDSNWHVRHEVEDRGRFLEERNPREELSGYHSRGQFDGLGSDRSSRDFRNFNLNPGNYESRRFVHDKHHHYRDRDRDVHFDPLVEIGGSDREHYTSREANMESERHGSKGEGRDVSHEFNRTPRKLVQKRSAFLRIQKPANTNSNYRINAREDDRVQCDMKSGSFRTSSSKEQDLYLDHGKLGEQVSREGSPVQLDVSFKSNSLVAKAIVTSPTSCTSSGGKSLTVGNGIVKKLVSPGKDASDSQLSKAGQGDSRLGKSEGVLTSASSCDKDLKQSKEKVAASGADNVHDIRSLLGPMGTNELVGNSGVQGSTKGIVSYENGASVVSAKIPSPNTEKKKKFVKKPVKRTPGPSLHSSCSQSTNNFDEPVKVHNLVLGLPVSSDLDRAAGTVDSGLCQNVVTVMPEIDNVKGSVYATASKNGAEDCDKLAVPCSKRMRGQSTSPLSSSGHKEIEFGKSSIDCVNELHVRQNTTMSADISENEKLSANIHSAKDYDKQLCKNQDTYLVENIAMDPSSKIVPSALGNTGFVSSSSEKEVQSCPVNSCTEKRNLENPLVELDDGITVPDNGTLDVTSRLVNTNKGGPSVENGMADQFPNACAPLLSIGLSSQSSFRENKAQNVAKCMQPSDQEFGAFLCADVACNSAEMNLTSSRSGDDDNDKQLSTLGLTMSVENVSIRAPQHSDLSKEETEKDALGSEQNDKSTKLTQLDLSRLKMSKDESENDGLRSEQKVDGIKFLQLDISSANVSDSLKMAINRATSAQWVDTTLRLSFKEHSPVEFTDSGTLSVEASLQHSPERTDVFHKSSSMDVSESNVSPCGASLRDNRKRKSSVFNLEFCSPTASDRDGGNVISGISRAGAEVSSCSGDGQTQDGEEVTVSGTDPPFMSTSDLAPLNEDITSLDRKCLQAEYVDNISSRKKSSEADVLTGIQSCSTLELLTGPKSWSLEWEAEEIVNANLLPDGNGHQQDPMDIDTDEGAKIKADAEEQQDTTDGRAARCQIPSELQSPDLNGRLTRTNVANDSDQCFKHDLPSMSTTLSSLVDCSEVSAVNCGDGVMELVTDPESIMGSLETLPDDLGMLHQVATGKNSGNDDKVLVEKPSVQGTSNSSTLGSVSNHAKVVSNWDPSVKVQPLFAGKFETLPTQGFKTTAQTQNAANGELFGRKNQSTIAGSRPYPSRFPFAFTSSKTKASSAHITKPRTWHRNSNVNSSAAAGLKANLSSDVTQSQFQNKVTKLQNTSYVRKHNSLSLVRKPVPIAAQSQISSGLSYSMYQPNVSGTNEAKKNGASDIRNETVGMEKGLRIGINASFERPRTPPLPSMAKVSNHVINSSEDHISSPITEPLHYDSTETILPSANFSDTNDAPKSTEDVQEIPAMSIIQNEPIKRLECHGELNNGKLMSSNVRSLRYVKITSNQLVATPNPCSSSIHNAHNSSSSDGYYKKKKNQIVRASVDSQVMQTCGRPNESSHLERQPAVDITSSSNFSKKQLRKVLTKTCKPSKFSLVWTLHGALRNNGVPSHCPKVLPHLVPWKRATYRRSFLPTLATNSNNRSLSAIGRKLLLLRKRDTVYTRSKHGFSLRKSKVLSVGGASLKWSKSIERHSKKANEEATIAVAAAERKKREQTDAASLVGGSKLRNRSTRERIFRIGSVRYKMDSSRSTLQRIPDEESLGSAVAQIQKSSQRSYVPRRLVIGKDEYVRIGNGNQLVRDPKKRTRILASEKVRWSLHTARSRLARKRKYCQFYTRFGKCNKDDGKCPYIHDNSKIAVCTKFLNGLCSNTDCKLTHEVIPERMPDCSYFSQGLCTNKDCPYRHVHVHPNASTCEGFLRGYCADGNECRKRHSNICPVYEATGSCPQRSKCKLHHPKNRTKGRKRKRSRDNKNAHGRYFGPMHVHVSDPTTSVFEKHPMPDKEDLSGDYISLDIDDEEAGKVFHQVDEEMSLSDSNSLDLKCDDFDELIRPIRIMQM